MTRAMTCRETTERLMDYLEHRLSERQRRALEAHLIACLRCREFLESYRMLPAIVKRATAAGLPKAVARRLHRALRHQRG